MVEIKLTDKYKIEVDKDNWTLVKIATVQDKESKNYGKEYTVPVSYNANLTHAIRSAIHHIEAERDASYASVKEYLEEYTHRAEELTSRVLAQREALREAGEVNKFTNEVMI
jgi:hypothetical protein